MPNRVANVLESYDFFGKSIPGIVALIGASTLLPSLPLDAFGATDGRINLAVLTALALTLVFSGLVIGQAVHTIADNVEKILYRVGNWTLNRYYIHGPVLGRERWENYPKIRSWLERRYWGIHDIFKSHRRLFENQLGWHFDISVSKRGLDSNNIAYDQFRERCKEEFGIDIARFDKTSTDAIVLDGYVEFRQLYPMITATLSSQGSGRANGFQARYSFCRGMWVVFFLLLLFYLGVLYSPITPGALMYKPLILKAMTEQELGVMMWIMFILSIAFMDASGDYKKHYIEYLISDFCVAVEQREVQGKDNKAIFGNKKEKERRQSPYCNQAPNNNTAER